MVAHGVINASVANIYDIAWHYASVDDRDATNAEIIGIKRDIDVANLFYCRCPRVLHAGRFCDA